MPSVEEDKLGNGQAGVDPSRCYSPRFPLGPHDLGPRIGPRYLVATLSGLTGY